MANLTQHIRATPQIVVAAVNGPAFGGGLSLSLACDLRVAARSATFCSAFIKTGLTGTDIGVTYLLPRLIGASRAFDLIVTGRTVDADTAEHLGIVSQVFDDDGFLDAALGMAEGIAAYTGIGPAHDQGGHVGQPRHAEHGRVHRAREPQPGDRRQVGRGAGVHARLQRARHRLARDQPSGSTSSIR